MECKRLELFRYKVNVFVLTQIIVTEIQQQVKYKWSK